MRNVVERRVHRRNQWRAVATGYENRAEAYQVMVILAALALSGAIYQPRPSPGFPGSSDAAFRGWT